MRWDSVFRLFGIAKLDDNKLGAIEDAREEGGLAGKAAADDHGCIAIDIFAACIGREKALIGCEEPVEKEGEPPLSAMRVAAEDKIKVERYILRKILGAVGEQDGKVPVCCGFFCAGELFGEGNGIFSSQPIGIGIVHAA